MNDAKKLMEELQSGVYDEKLCDIYVDPGSITYQKARYVKALEQYLSYFEKGDICIYSAPGRTELGGNHTDHQHGQVLAASIDLDAIAVASPLEESWVKVVSDGYDMITVSLEDLERKEEEKGTTKALIKGVLAGVKKRGYEIGGFQAYITSDVLIGAGLSSSAAYETLIGTILSGLYNHMSIPSVEIAMIGQYAENVYFGKPCGLMDQMACSVGGPIHVDFANPDEPKVEKIQVDMDEFGYCLCITDTKGSHADLTDEYAAVPEEMKKVARFFGKEVLRNVDRDMLLSHIGKLRKEAGDRAVLRAIHFIGENERVGKQAAALEQGEFHKFLELVKESGTSSFQYLQNVYSNKDVVHQNVSLALALSDMHLGERGVSRIHGGGFAGTIQAFVKKDEAVAYRKMMDGVFGENSCSILRIRKYGGIQVL